MKKQLPPEALGSAEQSDRALCELKLLVPEELCRAWQRCSWAICHETGKKRTDIMAEMIRDFLLKHGC